MRCFQGVNLRFFNLNAANVIHSWMSSPGFRVNHRRVARNTLHAGIKSQPGFAMTEGMIEMKALKKCHMAGLVACVSLVCTSGCSSVMMHGGPSEGYYPGTRASVNVLTDKDSGWVMKPLAAIDLPFSAVLDTLLLPLDYFRTAGSDSPRERVRRSEQTNHTDDVMTQTMAPFPANTPAP